MVPAGETALAAAFAAAAAAATTEETAAEVFAAPAESSWFLSWTTEDRGVFGCCCLLSASSSCCFRSASFCWSCLLSWRFRFTPHALHSVFGPSGPSLHCGVLVVPQLKHALCCTCIVCWNETLATAAISFG